MLVLDSMAGLLERPKAGNDNLSFVCTVYLLRKCLGTLKLEVLEIVPSLFPTLEIPMSVYINLQFPD